MIFWDRSITTSTTTATDDVKIILAGFVLPIQGVDGLSCAMSDTEWLFLEL
jgi:hypothetical protein